MSKPKKFLKTNTDEWKARGFKSTKSDVTNSSAEATSAIPPRLKKVVPKSQQRVSGNGKIQKKIFKKPGGAFKKKIKDSSANVEPLADSNKFSGLKKPSEAETKKNETKAKSPSKPLKKKAPQDSAEATEDQGNEEEQASDKKPTKRKKQKFQGYTLFVGNLSYETTKDDVMNHFSKCGPIKAVRLPLEKETNKPRGFAYLEVEDHVTYEKILSLHHSFLKKRRINVECTFGGSKGSQKRKALIKEKTLKLRFLSREGKIQSAKKRPWGKFVKAEGDATTEKANEKSTS